MTTRRLAITSGEPAGIGPDLCLRLADRDWPDALIVFEEAADAAVTLPEGFEEVDRRAYGDTQIIIASVKA